MHSACGEYGFMAIPSDWRDFLIQHPWAPRRVLIAKYGIRDYDVDNWLRGNPSARQILDSDRWHLTRDKSASRIRETMEKAWKYYIEEELGINVEAPAAVLQLIRIKTPARPFQFLVDGHYLNRLSGYTRWVADGYTRVSFAICDIWPGRAFADKRNLLPGLFLQTKKTALGRQDAIGLVKHIYLCFLCDSVESSEDADYVKQRFYARYTERGFITGAQLREHGMSTLHLNSHGGIPSLLEAVAGEFAADLGLQGSAASRWNGQAFRQSKPGINWDQCHYCGRRPVDLHHLLPRSEYPELVYDEENVVPVCVQVHAAITRQTLDDNFRQAYSRAQKAWLKASPGGRTVRFDEVMSLAHRETIGFPTDGQKPHSPATGKAMAISVEEA